MIKAPWSDEQVANLQHWQTCGFVHEFTCQVNHRNGADRTLIPTTKGWRCPSCKYQQNWAHVFMLNSRPVNPAAALQAAEQV